MDIVSQLERDEGSVPYAYHDSLGFWTIGVGFLIDKRKGGHLRSEEIQFILSNRVKLLTAELMHHFPDWLPSLNDARLGVLQNMAYNLGIEGLLGFPHFLADMKNGNWRSAADEMRNSLWAKQVHSRATRLEQQVLTGEWQ